MSTIVFEPRVRGIVTSFEVVRVERRREGDHEREDVTITAPVDMPDGRRVRKTMVVVLDRPDSRGRWIVTAVNDSESHP